ncbi:MAG: hypothetical protein ABIG68_09090 [Acidobacteriota bacterium]
MKSRKKKGKDSLLARLLAGGKKKGEKGAARKGKAQPRKKAPGEGVAKARALTRLERSIAEVKQMTKIGEKDPERLARLLAGLLAKEREKQRIEQDAFEKQVWEIVHRSEQEEEPPEKEGA